MKTKKPCLIAGCDSPAIAKSLCRRHYNGVYATKLTAAKRKQYRERSNAKRRKRYAEELASNKT